VCSTPRKTIASLVFVTHNKKGFRLIKVFA
jgi:hypothetical protein